MMKGRTIFAAIALGAVIVASGVTYAAVTSLRSADTTSNAAASNAAVDLSDFTTNPAGSVFLESDLSGRGSAVVVLRISRNQIMYEITWQGMTPPTNMPMLQSNGRMAVNLMPTAMPATINAIAGVINLNNTGFLNGLLGNPGSFRMMMATPQFPSGAVNGQFRRINTFDFNRILHVGQMVSVDSGDQVVPQGRLAGDMNAHATVFVGPGMNATTLNYAAIWTGVNSPTALNVNQGAAGMIGNLVVALFQAPRGLNPTIIAVAGSVSNVSPRSIAMLKANPMNFHTSLVTGRFQAGAARGQLFIPGSGTVMTTMPPTTMPRPTTTMTKPTTPTMRPPTTSMSQPSQPMGPPTGTMAPPHW